MTGATPTGSGCQPTASAADASSRSGIPSVELRVAIQRALLAALGDTYDCTRVWSAWAVGTMDEDDFVPVLDRLDELIDEIVAEIAVIPVEWEGDLTAEEQSMIDRAWDRHVAAGPQCSIPPEGWFCTRGAGHDGPCAAHAQGTSGSAQDAQRLDPQGESPVVEDHAPEPCTQTHTTKKKGE